MAKRETEVPWLMSEDYLKTQGRALMRWWNETGTNLPLPGEAYRGWWQATFKSFEQDFFNPQDVYPQLQVYSKDAHEWWKRSPRRDELQPPPLFDTPRTPVDDASQALGDVKGIVYAVAGIAFIWFVLRK